MKRTIYIKLLDEGVDVYRPVFSTFVCNNVYIVGSREDNDEKWEFEPNEMVEVMQYDFKDGKNGLVAVKRHDQ